jgi:hypothetical protein
LRVPKGYRGVVVSSTQRILPKQEGEGEGEGEDELDRLICIQPPGFVDDDVEWLPAEPASSSKEKEKEKDRQAVDAVGLPPPRLVGSDGGKQGVLPLP